LYYFLFLQPRTTAERQGKNPRPKTFGACTSVGSFVFFQQAVGCPRGGVLFFSGGAFWGKDGSGLPVEVENIVVVVFYFYTGSEIYGWDNGWGLLSCPYHQCVCSSGLTYSR
jgi:hypothetical protein